MNKAHAVPSRDSTPSPLRRARGEAVENKLREEALLQKQRNLAAGVGASKPRSFSISQEVEQQFVVIEEANTASEMRRVVVPSVQQYEQAGQATTQPLNLPLVPTTQDKTMIERNKTAAVVAV